SSRVHTKTAAAKMAVATDMRPMYSQRSNRRGSSIASSVRCSAGIARGDSSDVGECTVSAGGRGDAKGRTDKDRSLQSAEIRNDADSCILLCLLTITTGTGFQGRGPADA